MLFTNVFNFKFTHQLSCLQKSLLNIYLFYFFLKKTQFEINLQVFCFKSKYLHLELQ